LAVVIVVPLFFNTFTETTFEADKATLLRSVALVMASAWLIKFIEAGFDTQSRARGSLASSIRHLGLGNPLAIPTLTFAAIYTLTTLTSVTPRASFWGSYQRWQGTYTTLSYIAVFFLTSHALRTREQLERLTTAIPLVSLPISLYGIMQNYGLDPIPWAGALATRVISTLGNPIFLAAYLIMVIPLTLKQVIGCFSSLFANKTKAPSFILAGCYLLLLALQLACIIFAQSRGPFIGLMTGLFFFCLLLAVVKGKRGLALTTIGMAIGLLLFFAILNLPNSPLAPIKELPYIGRLGRIFEIESGTGRSRLLVWEGVIDLITADPMRAIIGHGPESMYVAFNRHFPPGLAQYADSGITFDRSHNETFDVLVTTGLVGFIAYLLLFGSVFHHGLRWLGLFRGSQQQSAFTLLCFAGGLFGAVIPWLLEGNLRFFGLGLPAGIVAALAIYIVMHILFWHDVRQENVSDQSQTLIIALLSAIVAHFVEIQFGIAITTTRAYFWLYLALMMITGLSKEEPTILTATHPVSADKLPLERRRDRGDHVLIVAQSVAGHSGLWDNHLISYSLLIGLILMTLGFAFMTNQFVFKVSNLSVPWLFFLVWLLSGIIIVAKIEKSNANQQYGYFKASSFLAYSIFSLGWFLAFIFFHVAGLLPGGDPANIVTIYYLWLLLTIAAMAAALMKGISLPVLHWRWANVWFYLILVLELFTLIFVTNLSFIRADIYYKQGLAYGNAGQWDASIALFRRALRWAPYQDRYYIFLAGACVAKAEATLDKELRFTWFEEAEKALERAREISPLDPDHVVNLGRFHQKRAEMVSDLTERIEGLKKALDYYHQATGMSPNNHGRRLEEDMIRVHLLLGNDYMAMGELNQAATAYTEAIELEPQKALQELMNIKASLNSYAGHRNLAIFYQQLGRIDDALSEAKKAKDLAPPREKAALESIIMQLQADKR